MKINLTKEVGKDTLLSHIVLHSMTKAVAKGLYKEGHTEEGVVCDIKLTVNGKEIDLKSFCNYWQNQVYSIVVETAKELIENKLSDIDDLLYNLEETLKSEINKRLEDQK